MTDEQRLDLSSGLEPSPGVFRLRSRRGAPWQPVKILYDGYEWHVLIIGQVTPGSGRRDPFDIPLIKKRWPLHEITQQEYDDMIAAYARAKPGSPLKTPDQPVNLRGSPAL